MLVTINSIFFDETEASISIGVPRAVSEGVELALNVLPKPTPSTDICTLQVPDVVLIAMPSILIFCLNILFTPNVVFVGVATSVKKLSVERTVGSYVEGNLPVESRDATPFAAPF